MEVDYTKQNLGQREKKLSCCATEKRGYLSVAGYRYFKTARPSIMSLKKKKEKDQEYE